MECNNSFIFSCISFFRFFGFLQTNNLQKIKIQIEENGNKEKSVHT